MIRSSTNDPEIFNVKVSFIKAKKEKVLEFKDEFEKLYEKYNLLEDEDCDDMYGLVSIISPHKN